jgi:hypothetical protein
MSDDRFDPAPSQLLHFVELDEFRDDWQSLKLNVEVDLLALQYELMRHPDAGDVVAETGGMRKLRFAPPGRPSGKRGAVRVCYAWFPDHWLILLIMAYGKSVKGDLTRVDKQGIRTYLARIEQWLDEQPAQRKER